MNAMIGMIGLNLSTESIRKKITDPDPLYIKALREKENH
jgi:hypothetical protein